MTSYCSLLLSLWPKASWCRLLPRGFYTFVYKVPLAELGKIFYKIWYLEWISKSIFFKILANCILTILFGKGLRHPLLALREWREAIFWRGTYIFWQYLERYVFRMTYDWNDICSEWQMFGMTYVWNDMCLEWHLGRDKKITSNSFFGCLISIVMLLKHPLVQELSKYVLEITYGPW